MKNSELIELLKTFPLDMEVITEGCDCYGSTGGAKLIAASRGKDYFEILITRDKTKD